MAYGTRRFNATFTRFILQSVNIFHCHIRNIRILVIALQHDGGNELISDASNLAIRSVIEQYEVQD